MKTSEFTKWLDDSEFWYIEEPYEIEVNGFLSVMKTNHKILFYTETEVINVDKDLLKKAIEYAETPILEREDKKEYIIKIPFYIDSFGMNTYNFSIHQDKDNSKIIHFTEKEIKAIDERLMAFAEEVKE